MNQIAWQIYGGSNRKANTFIGGVASTITTAGALATKLGIASNRITNFKIVGSDIECRISGSYVMQGYAWNGVSSLKYFNDVDGLVTSIGASAFEGTSPGASFFYFKNVTSIGNRCFYNDNKEFLIRALYIPNCTTMGSTVNNSSDVCFGINQRVSNLYVNPSMSTINSGGIEADIAYTSSFGFTNVRYVANFTAPSAITDLSVGNVYGTAVQLNFTAPTGSTNAIDYYEVYVNGVYKNNISGSGGYATGLTLNTSYTIEVKPVDIFYNKSTSNVVSQTTLATPVYQDSLVSYYKMQNNVLDSWGTNNGTATAITYASGLVGQTAIFNGSSSKIDCTNNANLQLTTGSITCILNSSSAGSSFRGIVVKQLAYGIFLNDGVLVVYDWGASSIRSTGINLNTGVNNIITLTFKSGITNGSKLYINNTLVLSFTMTILNQTVALNIGSGGASSQFINAKIDEVSIFNTELTALQISEINAKLNTGQSLI